MSISRKETKKIIKAKKQHIFNEKMYFNLSEKLLTEKLGSFEFQYEIANELANVVNNMLTNEIYNFEYNTHSNLIGVVKIILNTNGIFPNINASFEGLTEKNETVLKINITKNIKNEDNTILLKKITNAIAHELMHSNVIQQKLKNVEDVYDVIDIPKYYNYVINMMDKANEDTILYWYSRALYVTYYHEVNAIVSQTHIQIFNQLGYGKERNNDEIKKALIKTEPYITYSTILNDIIPTIKNMSDNEIYNNISIYYEDMFNLYDINVDFIKKSLNKIEKISKNALYKICRNAMIEGKAIMKDRIIL